MSISSSKDFWHILNLGAAPQEKPLCYEEIDTVLTDKKITIPSHFIASKRTGSNIPTDNSDSDTFDNEVSPENQVNAANIPVLTIKKTLAGCSRPLPG